MSTGGTSSFRVVVVYSLYCALEFYNLSHILQYLMSAERSRRAGLYSLKGSVISPWELRNA